MKITINIDEKSVSAKTKFRQDMDIKKAFEDLTADYIEEAFNRCDEGRGQKTKVAEMLGFKSYQAYAYWAKRKEEKKGKLTAQSVYEATGLIRATSVQPADRISI